MMRSQSSSALRLGVALASLLAACGGPQYPNCNDDSNCHENEFCVNGTCQQCRPDANDCPSGQQCMEGRCEPIEGYCASSGDCPDGQECRNNRCVTSQVTTSEPEDTTTTCSLSPVYFAYDSSELDSSARSTMQSNADCIQQRQIGGVRLTGHTDPRGTEEYNLALSDRRALSVKKYMVSLGVSESAIRSTGMGEEMAVGTDEASYRQDRRVDFAER